MKPYSKVLPQTLYHASYHYNNVKVKKKKVKYFGQNRVWWLVYTVSVELGLYPSFISSYLQFKQESMCSTNIKTGCAKHNITLNWVRTEYDWVMLLLKVKHQVCITKLLYIYLSYLLLIGLSVNALDLWGDIM